MLSRVADSLYWMSRYLERAEHTARVLDVNAVLMLDQSQVAGQRVEEQRWERMLASLDVPRPAAGAIDARTITAALTLDLSNRRSIASYIGSARDNARQVREHISSEMWEQLNRLYLEIRRSGIEEIWHAEPHAFFRRVKEGIHLFEGITNATLNEDEGWHFIEAGRYIERASETAGILDCYFTPFLKDRESTSNLTSYLDWVGLLKSRTAFEAYCQVYTADLRPEWIAEFLILNPNFPQSVRFAARHIQKALQAIARETGRRTESPAERLAGRLRTSLDYAQIDEIFAGDMHAYLLDIRRQCEQLHAAIHRLYVIPPLVPLPSS
ncbi:MAG: alpha-E domain-containing protein [Herpetosiphon sp.]